MLALKHLATLLRNFRGVRSFVIFLSHGIFQLFDSAELVSDLILHELGKLASSLGRPALFGEHL